MTIEQASAVETAIILSPPAPQSLSRADLALYQHAECAKMYVASLQSEMSRNTARSSLRKIARIVGAKLGKDLENDPDCWLKIRWASFGVRETTFVRAKLLESAPNTAKLGMCCLRGVLLQAFKLGYMSGEAYLRAKTTPKIGGSRLPVGIALPAEDVGAVFDCISSLPRPYQESQRALFSLAIMGGMRRIELARARPEHFEPTRGIRVLGKGDKERFVPLTTEARKAVLEWLDARGKLKVKAATLFVVFPPSGVVMDRPMSIHSVWRSLKRLAVESGVDFRPHDLRRTFATEMLKIYPLPMVQYLMGHDSPTTTARYDIKDAKAAAAAVEKVFGKVSIWGRGGFERKGGEFLALDHAKRMRKEGASEDAIVAVFRKMGVTRHGRQVEKRDLA